MITRLISFVCLTLKCCFGESTAAVGETRANVYLQEGGVGRVQFGVTLDLKDKTAG